MAKIENNNEELNILIRFLQQKTSESENKAIEDVIKYDLFLSDAVNGMSAHETSDMLSDLNSVYKSRFVSGQNKLLYVFLLAVVILLVGFILLFNNQVADIDNLAGDEQIHFDSKAADERVVADSFLIAGDSIVHENDEVDRTVIAVEDFMDEPEMDRANVRAAPVNEPLEEQAESSAAKTRREEKKPVEIEVVELDSEPEEEIEAEGSVVSVQLQQINNAPNALALGVNSAGPVSLIELESLSESANVFEDEASKELSQEIQNAAAEPVIGFSEYDAYLNENMVYPPSEERQRRQVLRVQFEIDEQGNPRNYEFSRSPENLDFQYEVIRLIENGPQWQPAYSDGLPVKDLVDMRIVFRP